MENNNNQKYLDIIKDLEIENKNLKRDIEKLNNELIKLKKFIGGK